MKTFFTADHHFNHSRIISYTNRPYKFEDGSEDLQSMNQDLIATWNSEVGPDDLVYHLGDFAMGPKGSIAGFVSLLNGHKILIKGNHDRNAEAMRKMGFNEVLMNAYIKVDGKILYLHHKPVSPDKWTADYHLCGHVHNEWRRRGNIINVGVDVWDNKPRQLHELIGCVDEEENSEKVLTDDF